MHNMIFEPIHLGGIALKNRIIRSATHDGLADNNGGVSDELIRKYAYLAKNDVGCIITGYAAVSANGMSPYPRMLRIDSDNLIDNYKQLTEAVHQYNTPIVLQIAHCGRQTSSKAIGCQKVAPTAKRHLFYPDKAKALDEKEIYDIIYDFSNAAVRAERAGFDAVQLHCGHGYLLHDFLSGYGNKRTDKWGGSLQNRCRIVCEIIRMIKQKTKLPVWIKMSASDNRRGGMNIDDSVQIAKILERSGCDCIEVSCGTVEDGMNTMRSRMMPMDAVFRFREPCASFPPAFGKFALAAANFINPLIKQPQPLENFNVENAAAIKNAVSIPIIVVGGIHKLDDIRNIINHHYADCVSMCRAFICEPNLVHKFKSGQQDDAKCIMCNYCGLVIEKESTKCLMGIIK